MFRRSQTCTIGAFTSWWTPSVEAARRPAPPPPEWLIEYGIGAGRPTARGSSAAAGDTRSRCKPATTDLARRPVADGVQACPACRPDTALGVLE
ncbi:DUF6233 domain-containing protein [Streptomyces sp. NPDC088762]|uniref:DUF6233 domain-containing protein n=1 Tax=Streptomyces sp. NPDC088762 TaxID=3365891 RepID=UPI00381F98E9